MTGPWLHALAALAGATVGLVLGSGAESVEGYDALVNQTCQLYDQSIETILFHGDCNDASACGARCDETEGCTGFQYVHGSTGNSDAQGFQYGRLHRCVGVLEMICRGGDTRGRIVERQGSSFYQRPSPAPPFQHDGADTAFNAEAFRSLWCPAYESDRRMLLGTRSRQNASGAYVCTEHRELRTVRPDLAPSPRSRSPWHRFLHIHACTMPDTTMRWLDTLSAFPPSHPSLSSF